jgi:hypothetical protein
VGRRRLASAGVKAPAGAQVTLRLRLSRAAVKILRRTHAKRLTVTATLMPAAGGRATRTASVRIAGPPKVTPATVAASVATARATAPVTARFSGSFEAERVTTWDQPRGVNLIDCHGQHYYAASGEDRTSLKTRRSFAVTVTKLGRNLMWQFGEPPSGRDPLGYGVEAHGVSTRSQTVTSGSTGGWCGSAETTPPPATDCGTRLPVYQTLFAVRGRELTWSASFAQTAHERYGFYNCPLITPAGMYADSFPTLPGRINTSVLFSGGKRAIEIAASKKYGPTSTPVPNFGVLRTAHGTVKWKLTLTHVRAR